MVPQPLQEGRLIQQFKLWLAEKVEQEEIPFTDKTAIDIIADYMERFHEHIFSEIQKTSIMQDYTMERCRYVLTVPAIWSDQAKAIMRSAFIRARIITYEDPSHRLVMITEPEAAALYCERKYNAWNLKHDDTFIIVDAGGGTVDLIVYKIEQQGESRILHEVTKGYGGMCGSVHIDNKMRELLNNKLGESAHVIPSCTFETIMQTFTETIKKYLRLLVSIFQKELWIRFAITSKDGYILLTADELRQEVFGPVFQRVLDLIDRQLHQANVFINAMFLVGGFGCSEYLYDTLKYRFAERVGTVVMPPRGELAVVRGAVYSLLRPGLVASKILRRTYGVRTRLPFEEGLDPEESAVVTKDGVKRCGTRFDIIARKGDRIGPDTNISKSFWVTYPKHTEADLYAYDGEGIIPRHVTDPGVVKIAEFPVKMPVINDLKYGDRVDVNIDFVLRTTELQINVSIAGNRFQFTSLLETELQD
ncbi:Heat shock 70 kDa protein 12A [Apophysomyces ossiformis]|uniref:Heat shock 70 kDa protein 12A n=1 Tax=Apophysomyces ossiformis TaxID=679940 RepID=A0A8H7BS78_9FUNG|nr:Heat shock 70 kDa protein 12A [Apophysomyces ossiformis]